MDIAIHAIIQTDGMIVELKKVAGTDVMELIAMQMMIIMLILQFAAEVIVMTIRRA